jgi:hypothetical protein
MKKVERDNENSENSCNYGIRQFPLGDNISDWSMLANSNPEVVNLSNLDVSVVSRSHDYSLRIL